MSPAEVAETEPVEEVSEPERIADQAQIGNKIEKESAIKKELPIPIRQKKEVPELPSLLGRPGRVHSDELVDDILDTMLRDGKAPYGKARQQFNYKFHPRLLERLEYLEQTGTAIHPSFRTRKFWREWSAKTRKPISTEFYRKFA